MKPAAPNLFRKAFVSLLQAVLICLSFSSGAWADNVTYTYDALNRLIRAEYEGSTIIEYTYDAAGNRTSQLVGSIVPTPVVVNNFVTFAPVTSSFSTTANTSGCPAGFVGKFSFNARLSDKSSSPALSNLLVKVTALSNGNLLQNADGGPAGVGATLTVPKTGGFADALLGPGQFVDVPFAICLKTRTAFSFFVDVLGVTQ
ncbi:MAG: RHS repeat domain-containing protein [Deltaproteobacteria bacterium]|nr:RHS repeat domain-containing protein [Deltaproteobacteria bacterium]